ERRSVVTRSPEVDSGENARILHFFQGVCKTPEWARHAQQEVAGHVETGAFAELVRQNRRCGSADARVAGRIIRMRGRGEERRPSRIRCCCRIAIVCRFSYGCNWPPEVIRILRVPASNSGVGY